MIRNISIPSDNVASFQHRIAKLNKRAVKLGLVPVVVTTTATYLKEFNKDTHYKSYFVEFADLEIVGEDPVLAGYRFIASIDQDDVLGVMINVMPGMELPVSYRESHGACDHCKTKRNRKKTVVVQHVESGEYLEIGRMCLKDFLETNRIDRYTWLEAFTKSIDEFAEETEKSWNSGSGRYEPIHNLVDVLACAINSISEHGFISRKYADEYSTEMNPIFTTTSRMWKLLYGDKYAKPAIAPYNPTAAELEEAGKIVEWAKTVNPDSDYNYMIRQMAVAEATKDKYMGFAVSIVPAYRRAMGLIVAKEKKEALPKSEYVSEVGARVEFTVTYMGEYSFSSYYGTCTIYRFREGANNNVVWMSSVREDFEVGKEYEVKATVKKHDVYRDEKQTTLSRVKVKEA